jgi:hypothetical protein
MSPSARRRRALHAGLGRRRSPACRATRSSRWRASSHQCREDQGPSMVIIGAAMNHWYHMDMNYRGVINMLVMCGCVGQSGGGWAHYVGQEKLRPQTGWRRSPSRSTGPARRGSRTRPRSSTPIPTSGATRPRTSPRSCRRRRRRPPGTGADRLQHPRRAHGLAAVRAAAQDQPAAGGARRPPPRHGAKDYVARALKPAS